MKRIVYVVTIAMMSLALYTVGASAEGLNATIVTTKITIDTNLKPANEAKVENKSVETENEKKREKEKERKHKDKDREDN